ncbi:unnamed protein product [Arctia plantaginis]|uniref:EGF-like domain-containing protein n=1 Tax=Arctia plantaginis TaxID=874455 RepID=A0A8S1B7K9_ARCPL|nr:unnamed protein product [Arctia plantaginis]
MVLYLVKANSKVCSEEKVVNSLQLVSYVRTYTELHNAICVKNTIIDYDYYEYIETTYNCLKTVTNSKLMTRYQPQVENKTVYFCCPGYSQIDNLNSNNTDEDDIKCEPICDPPCQNGLCEAPQKCLCLPGYISGPDPSTACLPVCDLDCGHGICDKPNTCKCFSGYELTHTTSHAVCTEIQHKDIECISGYIKSGNGTCEPKCSNGCINGFCISPETCQCNPGFHLEPINIDGSKICKPDCDPGYKHKGGTCHPQCHHSCGNGTCILPNVCECFRGYKIDITQFSSQATSNGFLCIPSCKGVCAGECVAPNTCITSTVTAPSSKYRTDPLSTTTSLSTPQSTTSLSTASLLITPRTTTSRFTSFWWTTPRTTTSRSTPFWWTTPRTTTSHENAFWSTLRTTISQSTAFWWTTPRTTISWSTNPISTSLSTTRQYTEENHVTTAKGNSTKTVKINPSESTHNGADKTWVEQHWASVLLTVLLLLFAMLVMIIVLRRKPIIIFLRGRSYVVEDDELTGYNIDQRVHYSKRKDNLECK